MHIEQLVFESTQAWQTVYTQPKFQALNCQLVLAFSERTTLEHLKPYDVLRARYPSAHIVTCSTAGQIAQTGLPDNCVVSTAIEFEKSSIQAVSMDMLPGQSSQACGEQLMQQLSREKLRGVLVLSEGSYVNGSELLQGIASVIPASIPVFGGLAGDQDKFVRTIVGLNAPPTPAQIVAIGFYGDHIQVCHGTSAGWDDFGPMRTVTQSEKNVLYALDGRPALDLYKEYLGLYAEQLPGSALHFPLSLQLDKGTRKVVRTILSVNENDKSMTFAGNIPQGMSVRLMKANADTLIDASNLAAKDALQSCEQKPQLALLISCVGRRIVLGHRIEEELEAAREVFGEQVVLAGMYSYGEISPTRHMTSCDLHNQTMTIATLSEFA
jgi:hypothetical protein